MRCAAGITKSVILNNHMNHKSPTNAPDAMPVSVLPQAPTNHNKTRTPLMTKKTKTPSRTTNDNSTTVAKETQEQWFARQLFTASCLFRQAYNSFIVGLLTGAEWKT